MLFHHGQISTDPLCSRIRRLVSKDLKLEQDSQVWGFKREVFSNRHFPGELEGKVSALEQIEKRQQLNQLLQVSNYIFFTWAFHQLWTMKWRDCALFNCSSWIPTELTGSEALDQPLQDMISYIIRLDAKNDVFGSWFLPVFQGKDGWQCCFE